MLQIKALDVLYGDVQVIWNVSFEVREREIVGLIGANGAGKSTILKTISGILRPERGEVFFDGMPIHTLEPYKLIDAGLAHVPEARRLFVEMTVEENLDMGSLRGQARAEREKTKEVVFDLFPRLRDRRRQLCGTLSGGEQQMVAIGRGLMSKPKLIMFDEPSLGLAPMLVKEIFSIINRIRQGGATVLIVEQNVKQSLSISDRAYVLETGRIVLEGSGESILNNDHVKTAYLGV
jgi:branched-chain amino acid transport system ATP-binding protein